MFPTEFAAVKGLDHPKAVYVRESAILPRLDAWIAELFDPENLDVTCKQLANAGDPDEGAESRREAAHRKLDDCDRCLEKYRAALEADADPVIVAGWMAEVNGARLAAERELAELREDGPMPAEEIRKLVESLSDIPTVLAEADPKLKAKLYAEFGISIRYEPGSRVVIAEARPVCANSRVGGPSSALPDWRIQPW